MKKQKATLPATAVQNGKNYGGDKEMTDTFNLVVYSKGELFTAVTLRLYMGRSRSASVVYASLWCNGGNFTAGHGSAGGYGYCKRSAAAGDAIRNAGIRLEQSISGVGIGAVHEALKAIGRAMGYRKSIIVEN